MKPNEFDIIDQYFKSAIIHDDVITHIGDDAAQIRPKPGKQFLVHTNTLTINEKQGYEKTSPTRIVSGILTPGIEKIVSMGGSPAWATIAITLPYINHDWLAGFKQQLNNVTSKHNIEIIGGDTTHGPASICCTVIGYLPGRLG